MRHTLLPRSTGLHYSLRSLSPRIPSLQLIDITVTYPGKDYVYCRPSRADHDLGIPAYKYGQSYYTLRSIFLDGVPPPTVHMHIRKFNVAQEVPIGDLSATNSSVVPSEEPQAGKTHADAIEVDIPEAEKEKFDEWLRDLWRHKDDDIERYLNTGSFTSDPKEVLEIPVALKRKRDALDAFCFFVPAVVGWLFSRMSR